MHKTLSLADSLIDFNVHKRSRSPLEEEHDEIKTQV